MIEFFQTVMEYFQTIADDFWKSYDVIRSTMPFLLEGLWMTFKISIITIFFGSLLGSAIGLLRTMNILVVNLILGAYIHTLRGTPFLIHLYVVYFILPTTGISWLQLEAFPAAIIALSMYTSTYVAEIVRAAIQAVPRGQSEAARSVGMTYIQRMRHVVLPQAIARVIPPLLGQTAVLIKDSSLVSFIGVFELFGAGLFVYSERLKPNEGYLTVAACYLVIYFVMMHLANSAQRRLGGGRAAQ